MSIQFKRGTKATIPSSADIGQPLYATDTKELFIGSGANNQLVPVSNKALSDQISDTSLTYSLVTYLQYIKSQTDANLALLTTGSYPLSTIGSTWNKVTYADWTSGFFPGILWYLYAWFSDSSIATAARNWTAPIEPQKNATNNHDVGFQIFDSFGKAYQFNGQQTSDKNIILTTAASLYTRYNSTVGCTRSWDNIAGDPSNYFKVIMDNMMNLELLMWAANNGGSSVYSDAAISHALKTMTNHVRSDGSSFQEVIYDSTNGNIIAQKTVQGYSDSSTWSRGQAWGIHGFTMMYRYTSDIRFLNTAEKLAGWYIDHLPSDGIPYWDFFDPNIPNAPRDSSAATIALSGMIELLGYTNNLILQNKLRTIINKTFNTLISNNYCSKGTINKALIQHATYNKPAGNYDTGIIWGDYYLVEAVYRYLSNRGITKDTPLGVGSNFDGGTF